MEYLEQGEAVFTCDIIHPCCLSHVTWSAYYSRRFKLPPKSVKNLSPWDNPESSDMKKEWRGLIAWRKMSWNSKYLQSKLSVGKPSSQISAVCVIRRRQRMICMIPFGHYAKTSWQTIHSYVTSWQWLHDNTCGRLWHYVTSVLCIWLFIYLCEPLFIYLRDFGWTYPCLPAVSDHVFLYKENINRCYFIINLEVNTDN